MTFCSVSWPSSKASVDVSAEARRKEKFLEGKILVNGCLVFLEKSVEKITAQKGSSHDTDVGKLWEIVGQMGSYSRKSQTGIMRVGGWGYGISRGVIQETVYQNSRGSLKKE